MSGGAPTRLSARAHDAPLVLLVDHEPRTARRFAELLREDGFAVEIVSNGAAAHVRLGRLPLPDALVTDVTVPHADVASMVRSARARRGDIAVLFVTGYPHIALRFAANLEPLPRVFVKPIDYASFTNALRSAVLAARARMSDGLRLAMPPPSR